MNVNGVEGLGALTNQKRGEDDADGGDDGGDGEDESFSDVGEIRVYFASKILTPCRMH